MRVGVRDGVVAVLMGVAQAWTHGVRVSMPVMNVVLVLVFCPVLAHSGWPMNQEELSWKYRLAIYAAHARRFDLLPIWSESMALGLGAPAPVLYHKLFYLVALPVYLLLGTVKVSIIAALAAFDIADRLRDIHRPVLVMVADDDMLVPSNAGVALANGLPIAGFCRAEHGGHAVNVVDPDAFNSFVLAWMAGEVPQE